MRRRAVALAGAAAGLAVTVVPAHSAWTTPGGGTVAAQSASLPLPGPVTAGATTATTAAIRWAPAAPLATSTVAYVVERTPWSTTGWTAACGTSAASPTTSTSCTDTGLTAGTDYRYRVTSVLAQWRAQGTPSGRVTTAGAGTGVRSADCPGGAATAGPAVLDDCSAERTRSSPAGSTPAAPAVAR